MKLKPLVNLGLKSLQIIENDLKVEAGALIVTALQNIAVLSAFSRLFNARIPGLERSEIYKERAWREAENLGKMFISICKVMDTELECIKGIQF